MARMAHNDSCPLISLPLYNILILACELDLVNYFKWIENSKSDRISLLRFGDKETLASIFHAFSCLLSLREDSYYVVSWILGRSTWQGRSCQGRSWGRPSSKQQQRGLPTSMCVSSELDSLSLEPSDETTVLGNTLSVDLWKMLSHRFCEIVNNGCFKLLNSGVIYCVKIDKSYMT